MESPHDPKNKSALEDEKIIALFFARSEEAIEKLQTKYGGVCLHLSQNILNNRQDAEECVSDAYLGMWNAVPPARPHPLLAYLLKIVRNVSLKRYAHQHAAKRHSAYTASLQEIEACLPSPDTVESALETKELVCIIEDFLDHLKRENRVIFLRRYWFCDTYAEIAARCGLSEKAVSVRLTRIRSKLKQHLRERGAIV